MRLTTFAAAVLLSIVCVLVSCSPSSRNENHTVANVVSQFNPKYAKGFNWKVLADSSYIITLFNLESPGDTLQVIHWKPRKVERLACLSTTHIPFIKSLNKLNLIKGCGFADRTLDAQAKALFDRAEMVNLTSGNELEPEVVFSINPELLFVYPFGSKSYEKFLAKGIGCVQVSEYLEKHPLGRAEWIRLFGCLLGEQNRADSLFQRIELPYIHLRDSIASRANNRPTVFAGSMDGDRWAVPSANSYMATLLSDAGGNYIFSDTSATGNLVLPFESFFAAASSADYWGKIIYESDVQTADVITQGDGRLREFNAFRNRHVFICNAQRTDYHGQAVLEPHRLLEDLHHIFTGFTDNVKYSYFEPWKNYE